MDKREEDSLDNLQTACVEIGYLANLGGISWPVDASFDRDFATFQGRRATPCEVGRVHRYAFETFLKSQGLASRNEQAAKLGMTPPSLDRLLEHLPEIGLPKKYQVYRGIIDGAVGEDLVRTLEGLRFRTFGTHDSFCELLHGKLRAVLGIEIDPLYCATADKLGDARMFASTWDNITLLPLSVKHGVWLDFGKPFSLSPDRCSKLFYAENRDVLRTYIAGRDEPRDLEQYSDFAARSA